VLVKDSWGHYLEQAFQENLNRIALVDVSHNARYSYRDLHRQIQMFEKALVGYGISKGTHVALLFPSSATWIVAFLALIRIGAVPVCLNQESTDGEIRRLVLHSDSRIIITDEETYVKVRLHEEEMDLKKVVIIDRKGYCSEKLHCSIDTFLEYGRDVSEERVNISRSEVNYDDILAIQYTSGTTGLPKAVMSVHYKVLSNVILFRDIFKYTKEDKIFSSLPMYHMMGCFFSCLLTFITGGSLVLMSHYKTNKAIQALIDEECTSFHSVPTMFKLIINKIGDRKFTNLNKCMIAGSYCEPEVMKEIKDKLGIQHIFPAYGQSEGNGYTQIRMGDPIEKMLNTVGRPVHGVEIKVVDQHLREVPPYTEGELVVRSDYMMAGYYKDQEATSKLIKDDWIYTGDLGKVDEEGYVMITGRKKDIIVRAGENISPLEIEATLRESEEIKDVVVVGVSDEIMGQEIGACIILEDQAKSLQEEVVEKKIAEYMTKKLAKHKRPKYIKFVESFPLTGSGKIQKTKLAQTMFG